MKYVMFYESAEDVLTKAAPYFDEHVARLNDFHTQGKLLMVGVFGDPQEEGSMAIFAAREGAEEFVQGDPFILNGVIRNWYVREWNEMFES